MLPLIIKDYNWSQTVDMIYLKVHVKGIRAAKTSFVTADNYIRVSDDMGNGSWFYIF